MTTINVTKNTAPVLAGKQCVTADLQPGAVTDTEFAFIPLPGSGGTAALSGAGFSSGIAVVTINLTISSPNTQMYLFDLHALQTYTSTVLDTEWVLYNVTDAVTIADWQHQVVKTPYVSLAAAVSLLSGAVKQFTFIWFADTTINITNLCLSYMTFKV